MYYYSSKALKQAYTLMLVQGSPSQDLCSKFQFPTVSGGIKLQFTIIRLLSVKENFIRSGNFYCKNIFVVCKNGQILHVMFLGIHHRRHVVLSLYPPSLLCFVSGSLYISHMARWLYPCIHYWCCTELEKKMYCCPYIVTVILLTC